MDTINTLNLTEVNYDRRFKLVLSAWGTIIIGWILLALTMQAIDNTNLRKEREYLRDRLFSEMNLRTTVQQASALQDQIHNLYEVEIAVLKRQVEITRVDAYIAKVNKKLSPGIRNRIIQAAYACSDAVEIDPLFTLAVMEQESRFHIYAKSDKDAHGLMQLIPSTALEVGVARHEIYNIERNICGGATYLAKQLKANNGLIKAALRRYYGGGEEWEYSLPVIERYTKFQRIAKL